MRKHMPPAFLSKSAAGSRVPLGFRFAALTLLLAVTLVPATAHDIVRRANSNFPIASSVLVPEGSELVFLSGTLADVADSSAPAGSVERLGDTATQTKSVLGKIAKELESHGLGLGDVVKMNVFLVGDPKKGSQMDFEGLMQGYLQFFGPNATKSLPARTTVQVAGLPMPGALVEIEVVAARHSGH
jgi:enamine deaminase RidA (YjgF/YER057c/UK114 family)